MKSKKPVEKLTRSTKSLSIITSKWKILILIAGVLAIGVSLFLYKTTSDDGSGDLNSIMSAPLATNTKSKVAYVKDAKIYSANLDGTDTKVIYEAADHTNYEINASASPNGSKLAMLRDNRLYLMDADGGHRRQVINEEVLNFVWSPRGDYLLYRWQQYPAGHKKFADDPGDFTCVKGGDGCAERFTLLNIKSGKNQSVHVSPQDQNKYFLDSYKSNTAPYIVTAEDPADGEDFDPYKSNDYFSRGFGPQTISIRNSQTGTDTLLLSSNKQPYYMLVGVLPKQNMFVVKFNNKQSPIMSLEKRELDGSTPTTLASSEIIIQFVGGLE